MLFVPFSSISIVFELSIDDFPKFTIAEFYETINIGDPLVGYNHFFHKIEINLTILLFSLFFYFVLSCWSHCFYGLLLLPLDIIFFVDLVHILLFHFSLYSTVVFVLNWITDDLLDKELVMCSKVPGLIADSEIIKPKLVIKFELLFCVVLNNFLRLYELNTLDFNLLS